MKKKLHSALRKRRGITIAEVVVALAIIMLVSAATVTFLLSVSKAEGEVADTTVVNEHVENIIECYQWADGVAYDFFIAMEKVGFTRQIGDRYTLERDGYRINVAADHTTEPFKLEISVVNEDGEEIYGVTYE